MPIPCLRYQDGEVHPFEDRVSPEVRIELHGPGGRRAALWAYPSDLERLAVGHAKLTWCSPGETPRLTGREENRFLLEIDPARGSASETAAAPPAPPAMPATRLAAHMGEFIAACGLWDDTGCFHRAGAMDPASGKLVARAEDIGRHNCIDRLAGWAVAEGRALSGLVLLVSARITASLFAKALEAGFRVMVSRSAVTTASVEAARRAGVTLIGFARADEGRFTIFGDPLGFVTLPAAGGGGGQGGGQGGPGGQDGEPA